jgi:putative transposase
MTTAHDIDWPQLLTERLTATHPNVLRELLATFIHTLMDAEADAQCGAEYGQRSAERTNQRNGYRNRQFDTRARSLDLAIPKLRHGSYFPEWLLKRRKRAERAVTTVVATCHLLGVSTRRMDKLVETLGITSLSKSQVSGNGQGTPRRGRSLPDPPIDAGPYTFMAAYALALKVREQNQLIPGPASSLAAAESQKVGLAEPMADPLSLAVDACRAAVSGGGSELAGIKGLSTYPGPVAMDMNA